jgi:hypothetical protein
MTVVTPAMHLAASNYIDAGDLLLQHRSLRRSQLRIDEIAFGELTERNEAIQGLVPPRDAVRADDRGCVAWISRHCRFSSPESSYSRQATHDARNRRPRLKGDGTIAKTTEKSKG